MTYADPAAWAERQTDAGTRDPLADRGSVDDQPYDEETREYDDDELLDPDTVVLAAGIGCAIWVGVMAAMGWL